MFVWVREKDLEIKLLLGCLNTSIRMLQHGNNCYSLISLSQCSLQRCVPWGPFRRLWKAGLACKPGGGRKIGLLSRGLPAPWPSGPEHPRDPCSYRLSKSNRCVGQVQHASSKLTANPWTSYRYFWWLKCVVEALWWFIKPVWLQYACTQWSLYSTHTSRSLALTIGDLSIEIIKGYFDVWLTLGDGAL